MIKVTLKTPEVVYRDSFNINTIFFKIPDLEVNKKLLIIIIILVTALLIYNSHTIRFIHVRCTSQ